MIRPLLCLVSLPLLVSCAGAPTTQPPRQATAPAPTVSPPAIERTFVRGVYYGNQFESNAAAAGKTVPAFLDQLFRDLRETYHCNLFWINTGGIPDQLATLDIAAKHDLKVLCSARWDYSNFNGPLDTEVKLEAVAKQVTDAFKSKPACAGYVICEEDDLATAAQMDYVRQLFERYDPSRPGITVTCGGGVVQYGYRTGFPILCPEAYVWGGPNAVYCPNTPESSHNYYTQMINGLGNLSRKTGKPAWMMTQAYAAADGKQWLDSKGNLIIEQGSAWATRMPTQAEIRFQIWDAVRAGCRGVVFFLLMPSIPDWRPDKPNPTEADRSWEAAMDKAAAALKGRPDTSVAKERIDTGDVHSLLNRDGSPTLQSRAMGEAFAAIEKLEPLIVSWKWAAFPAVFADHPAAVNTFEVPARPGQRFAVVVNHDIASKQSLHLLFAPNVTRATDLRTGKDVALRPSVTDPDGLSSATVSLQAGDGTILELSFQDDRPGMLLFEEDFTRFSSPLILENTERINFPFASGIGDYWAVRKVRAPVAAGVRATGLVTGRQEGPTPCARLTRLQETPINLGPLGGSLTLAAQGLCDVFLAVEGTFPKGESLIIETVNKDGQEAWLRSDAHFRPSRIPAKDAAGKEITEIRFLLSDDAVLTGVRCWRVEKAGRPITEETKTK